MAKFPEPNLPAIQTLDPDVCTLDSTTMLWRIYFAGGEHPETWNTFRRHGPVPTGRFDHHLPPPGLQRRSISYVAASPAVCLAEVYQTTRTITPTSEPRLTGYVLSRPVQLLDLRGLWPTRARSSQVISSGPKSRSQRWARAIAATYPEVEGVVYRSSMHAGDDAWALWGCRDALPAEPTIDLPLHHPGLAVSLHRIARALSYQLQS